MKISIHQPNYLPYIGFFNKIKNSDIFILFDTAQYVKNDFHNRNKIRNAQGEFFLTIPIKSSDCFRKRICDVRLPDDKKWAKEQWKSIFFSYKKAKHFGENSGFFEQLYASPPRMLLELNETIIRFLLEKFEIKTKIIKASELDIDKNLKATKLLIAILKAVDATAYISGRGRAGQEHYLEEENFIRAGIELIYQDFQHPIYEQAFPGFIKNLSAIDLLFNVGKDSGKLI